MSRNLGSRRRLAAGRIAARAALVALTMSAASIPTPSRAQFFNVGGVAVDPQGMLREAPRLTQDERLKLAREVALAPGNHSRIDAASPLRKISLKRFEQAWAKASAAGNVPASELRFLAGLTEVRYVFLDPQAGDVVLAGPAEGWEPTEAGDVVGRRSRRPVLRADDLIAAVRYAFSREPVAPFVGCSIDPTPEGAARMAEFVRRFGAQFDRSQVDRFVTGMAEACGPQQVRVFGVPGSNRTASALVAADYRLKRLAMAHDPSPVPEVVDYLALAGRRLRNPSGAQPQHRWWFVGRFEAVEQNADGTAFGFVGPGVEVATAPRDPAAAPEKGAAVPQAAPAAKQFAESATKHFARLAERIPVFADLQNIVHLLAASELAAQAAERGTTPEAGAADPDATPERHTPWIPTALLDDAASPLPRHPVPTHVPSLGSVRQVGGRNWITSVSGGVQFEPRELVGRTSRRIATDPGLAERRTRHASPPNAETWWWD